MPGILQRIQTFLASQPEITSIVYGCVIAGGSALVQNTPSTDESYGIIVAVVNWIDNRLISKPAVLTAAAPAVQNAPAANAPAASPSAPSSTALPPLPSGFNLALAKSSGFAVYENAAGTVILSSPNTNWTGQAITTWQNIDGSIIPSAPSLAGYTQL